MANKKKEKQSDRYSHQQTVQRAVNVEIHNRQQSLTDEEASSTARIVGRLKAAALNESPSNVARNELYALPNVLDPYPWLTNKFVGTSDMTKETRFAPKQMKAVDEVIDKCDKTISVVTNFIETTTNPDDLPAVHNHLTNIVADASNLRTSAVMTKRQMEILNATLD